MKPLHTMEWRKLNTWKRKYVFVSLLVVVGPVSPQFPMQMFQMPAMSPMMMPPPPPPGAAPAPPQEPPTPDAPPDNNDVAFAMPVPMPMPLQVAVPALSPPSFCAAKPRPPACPPCPPCLCAPACTPSFFAYCSPCHQKCRCTNGKEPPVPLPPVPPLPAPGPAFALPMPMPPPAIMVPIPPFPRITESSSSCSSESESSSSYSESSDDDSSASCGRRDGNCNKRSMKRGRRKHRERHNSRRKKKRFSRRSRGGRRDVIKPVLSFINSRGNVKLNRPLTANDVRTLTRDSFEDRNREYLMEGLQAKPQEKLTTTESPEVQNVRLVASEDTFNRPQILLVSDYESKTAKNGKFDRTRAGQTKQERRMLKQGAKELVFKPPHDKTIKNLSVSFQVA